MLVAAANPCKCGYLPDPARACARVPACGEDYLGRISGPLMDRFDLRVDVPPVSYSDLNLPANGDTSAEVAARVAAARALQSTRYAQHDGISANADAAGELLEAVGSPDAEARDLLLGAPPPYGRSDQLSPARSGGKALIHSARVARVSRASGRWFWNSGQTCGRSWTS